LIDSKINNYIDNIKSKVNINGFRKGQVPVHVIKEKYGQSIYADETEKLVNDTVKKIVNEHKIKIAIPPKVELKQSGQGKDHLVAVSFEIYPEVPEIDFKKIKVVKKQVEISAEDVNLELEKIAKYYALWNEQEAGYKVKSGDQVNIDYVGRVNKEEFEGGSAKGYQLEIGSKTFIDDFEEQLINKKAGDEVKVKVKFPKEYHASNLAGQNAEFEVKINKILTAKVPNLDDDLVKEKLKFETKKDLEDAIKKNLEEQFLSVSKNAFKIELFDFINDKYDFDLPQGLVDQQTNLLWNSVEQELKINPDKFKNDKEKQKAKESKEQQAKKILRNAIVIFDLAQKNKIEIQKEDFDKEIQKILMQAPGQENQVIEYYQKNPEAVDRLRESIIENKVIDFLINLPEIEKKDISAKDFQKYFEKLVKDADQK
jgi:trigger factor